MRALIQRVSQASVTIGTEVVAQQEQGFLILLGVEQDDGEKDLTWLVRKISQMRLFEDAEGKMNQTLRDVDGSVTVVSQFTLHASTKKGNRPSFIRAAKPAKAQELYLAFCDQLAASLNKPVQTGQFGANMQVALINDGPVTIWLDSRNPD